MRIFVYTLIIIATLALGSVASAEDPPHVITGQVVQREEHGIIVQSAKKRLDITTGYDVKLHRRAAESRRYSNGAL